MAKPTKTTETEAQIVEHSPIIEPTIIVEGHENPFIKYYSETEPSLFAVGYVKLPGTNTYVSYNVEFKAGKVVKIQCDEPNLKLVAEESAKINFVSKFVDEGE